MGLIDSYGGGGNLGSGPSQSKSRGLTDSYPGGYTPPAPMSAADQHTIASFTSLDPSTRLTLLGSLTRRANAGDQQAAYRANLLKPHYNADVPQAPNDQANGIGDKLYRFNQGLKGLGGSFVDQGARDVHTAAEFPIAATKSLYHLGAAGVAAATGNKAATNSNLSKVGRDPYFEQQYLPKYKGDTSGMSNAAITSLDFLTGGKGKAVAETLLGATKLTGTAAAKLVGKEAAKGSAIGAGYGVANYAKNGGDITDLGKNVALGAGIGAAGGAVAGGFETRAVSKQIAQQAERNALMRKTIMAEQAGPARLESGKPVEGPLGLPAQTSVPYKSNKTPGGGVLVDPNSPEARIVASSGKARLIPTQVEGQTKYAIVPKKGQNIDDLFRPGDKPTPTAYTTRKTESVTSLPGKNISDVHAPSASPETVVKAGQRIRNGPVVAETPKTTHAPLNDLMQQYTKAQNNATKTSSLKTLNGIIEHPDASPKTKAWAIAQRDSITSKGTMDNLAQDHSTQTGQPLAASHETLKQGYGDNAPAYQEAQGNVRTQTGVPQDIATQADKASQPVHQELPASQTKLDTPTSSGAHEDLQPNRSGEADKAGRRNVFAAMREAVSPESRSRLSQELGTKFRNAMGHSSNMADVEHLQNKGAVKHFNGLTEEQRIADVSNYERNGKSDLAPTKGYEKQGGYDAFYRKSMDAAHAIATKVLGEDKVGWIDNYVKHMYKFPDQQSEAQGTAVLRRLAGDKSFTKNRSLDLPLDEGLAKMRAAGIKVESAVNNREELRQFTVNNARRLEAFHNAYTSSLQDGLISLKHQPNYVVVPRTVIQAIAPRSVGETHYAAPEVAQMLNNITSKGLHGNRLYDLARDASATVTQIELSFSAYHAGMTAITNGVSHLANAFHEFGHGDFIGGSASLVKSIPGVGLTKDLLDGRALRKDLKAGDPKAFEKLATLSQAGGRLGLQHDLKSAMTDKMMAGFKSGTAKGIAGAIPRIPFSIAQQVSRPLMEYAIPRIKDGLLLDRAASIARQYGGLDSTEAKIALAKAQNSVDNRMGEVVFDNKFWNKTAKDLSQIAYLSAGYRSGTVFELGGGLADLARGKLQSERAAFLAALPVYVGTLGAVYQYIQTGKPPTDIKDYFYPKNGQKDANGNDIRVQLPSYMRDLKNMVTDPKKEITPNSPMMTTLSEVISNKDYFGNLVRNPNDSASQQAIQTGQFLLNQFRPISVQNSGKTGTGLSPSLETFVGITKAPAAESYSPAQKEIYKLLKGQGPLTPEQQAQSHLKQVVRSQVQAGKKNTPEMTQLAKDYTPSQFQQFLKGASDPLQTLFDKLPIESKIKFVSDLKPSDRQQVSLNKFITNSLEDLGTKGKVKDPHALNVFLKSQGVNVTDQKGAYSNPILRNYINEQKQAKKDEPKVKTSGSDYGQ